MDWKLKEIEIRVYVATKLLDECTELANVIAQSILTAKQKGRKTN